MSETEETCHVTEEVITTEVIVDAGCSTGEIVVADMDNDFVAEEVFTIAFISVFFAEINLVLF